MSALRTSLTGSLENLAASLTASRPAPSTLTLLFPVPPVTPAELAAQVRPIWDGVSEVETDGDVLRSALDLVGKDLVVNSIVEGMLPEPEDEDEPAQYAFQSAVQDRLDIVLTLYEVAYETHPQIPALEPGALFIPLLEDLVELVSQSSWRLLWTYVETRARRFTQVRTGARALRRKAEWDMLIDQNMPSSKGKALPLLRTINAFLRTLPRTPDGLAFRGRVHQFASAAIGIADKSAINMRGDYGDVRTVWEDDEAGAAVPADADGKEGKEQGDGDIKMDEDAVAPAGAEESFYATLWSLQHYFANPPSLDGPATGDPPRTPFETFRYKTDLVLPRLFEETKKEDTLRASSTDIEGRKRKRDEDECEEEGGFFYPRYLTGRKLLEHELADVSFRRQILLQYFILFQFLLNLTPASATKQLYTGGMPKTFVVDGDNQAWVKATVASIRDELRRMDGDGARFQETVMALMDRERRYAQWKNEQCPEAPWEIPPLDPASARQAAELWQRRLAPPSRYPFRLGSRPLSQLWNRGYTGIDQLKGWKRAATVDSLDKEIQAIEEEEEDDKAMGRDPPPENAARKTSLTWRALRIAAHTDLRHFAALVDSRDLHLLVKNSREQARVESGEKEREASEVREAREASEVGVGEDKEAEPEPETEEKAQSESRAEGEADVAGEAAAEPGVGTVAEVAAEASAEQAEAAPASGETPGAIDADAPAAEAAADDEVGTAAKTDAAGAVVEEPAPAGGDVEMAT
ncbi:hypothetical protein Q5752_000879 [Cryptotrichosporon argae]